MKYISAPHALRSSPSFGSIHHDLLGDVIVWRQHELQTWWNIFEPMFNHPLSRMFVNAFIDSLEFNETLDYGKGIFRKKKFKFELNQICTILGWGWIKLRERLIVNSANQLLSVALGQYAIECYDQKRYKVRWTEPRPKVVEIELEETTNLPPPKTQNSFPWSKDSEKNEQEISTLSFEQHSDYSLRLEGERVLIIPVNGFERFFSSCLAYIPDSSHEWLDSNDTFDSSLANLLATIIQSIASMFLSSEQPVYIIDKTSWAAYIEHYLVERGWGNVTVLDYNIATYELQLSVHGSKIFPLTLGMICGIWERAHGRTCKMRIERKNETFLIRIQSFLEYQNN